jgi:hypothetical protein
MSDVRDRFDSDNLLSLTRKVKPLRR